MNLSNWTIERMVLTQVCQPPHTQYYRVNLFAEMPSQAEKASFCLWWMAGFSFLPRYHGVFFAVHFGCFVQPIINPDEMIICYKQFDRWRLKRIVFKGMDIRSGMCVTLFKCYLEPLCLEAVVWWTIRGTQEMCGFYWLIELFSHHMPNRPEKSH